MIAPSSRSPVSIVGERALVERIRARAAVTAPHIVIGIGDDAAVLGRERGALDVVTADTLVEGVHFRRDWTAARAIGHKALSVNLSDLAAMGAVPRAALLTLCLPDDLPLEDFDALVDGFASLAAESGAHLVGGNLTRSPGPLIVDVTAIGAVWPRYLLRRDRARAGDTLFVTGTLGAAAAGLAMLAAGVDREALDAEGQACVARYERPDARTRCGRIVGRARAASAAMDLSDGLADAARAIAEASGAGVVVDASQLPLDPGLRAWTAARNQDPVLVGLSGGEDYELAFAVSPRRRSAFLAAARRCRNVPFTAVGRFVAERGAWLERDGRREPLPAGFHHF